MTHALLARLGALALLLTAPAAAQAPLLYVLEDADSRVTLYGSIHLLDDETEPLSSAARAAYAEAETVVLETDLGDTQAITQAFLQHAQYTDGRTLADVLGKVRMQKLRARLDALGGSADALPRLKPWAMQLALLSLGMASPDGRWGPGVDAAVLARARADGLPVEALETAEQQVLAFDAAPEAEQVEALMETVRFWTSGLGSAEDALRELVGAWARGDADALAEVAATVPAAVLRDRNAAWLPQIEALLAREGEDALVVVGVAHLVGPDSVVAMLRARGYEVTPP